MYENLDLKNIITPVNTGEFKKLLELSGYDKLKSDYLINSFETGFDLGYRGPTNIKQNSPNLKFTIGNKTELWNKVMKEVQLKRYAGPFKEIPFENYIQSPIGLVPKDGGKKTRLIFHLSYPRKTSRSVNVNTPENFKKVSYCDFDQAIKICLREGRGCYLGKSDFSAAFRHLGIAKKYWKYLVMKAQHPLNNQWYYFIDKCLPFGAAISCAHFQAFSDAVSHIVTFLSKKENVNYLDDFLFADLIKKLCNQQMKIFLFVCDSIKFPVSKEKTFWASTRITFLGLLIDTILQLVCIPLEKIEKAVNLINFFLTKKSKKVTLRQLEQLCGFLNFLGKCVVPGRVFTRRLYAAGKNLTKPNHHLKVTGEMRLDLKMWLEFLKRPDIFCRPFFDFDSTIKATKIDMYTDSSKNPELGMGGICGNEWFMIQWDSEFVNKHDPSINYLELFAVTNAVLKWIDRYQNRRIILFCDNMSVVHMINSTTSKCRNCMMLLRIITLQGLIHNVKISAAHISGKRNRFPDLLSRLKYQEFLRLAAARGILFNRTQVGVSEKIWPMSKVWAKNVNNV